MRHRKAHETLHADVKEGNLVLMPDGAMGSQKKPELLVKDLGWSQAQIEAAQARYEAFRDFWDVPEMDAYDAL